MSTLEFNNQLLRLTSALEYFAIHLTANDDDAKDLFQDTVLKALTYRDKFKEKTNLKAWLYTIMKNTFINNYRKAKRAKTILDTSDDLYLVNIAGAEKSISPETSYSIKEISSKIDSLEEDYRLPFEMHYTGFKYKEIAEIMTLPIGTVKSRIFIARKKLMDSLKGYRK